jgi:uncharacterized protein (TIGR02246 family)
MAGDLKDELMAIEKTAWTAWANKNGGAFRELVAEDAVQAVAGASVTVGRDNIMAGVSGQSCETRSFEFHDARARQLTPDFAVVIYTATQDTTCGGQKLPGKVYATNIYAKQGGKWRSISYQETPIE